ncbi:MAG: methyltransferase domain-containing protein [Defluviitaleaceae bacterium]|nr:methyltransferase domain-containing protein [Defluviitaleaceae bacterium]
MSSTNILQHENFPLSNKYDPMWIINNEMGPNPLWLAEFLVQSFDLKAGMRVLDLGCGKGITSVFLAREFGVQVFAADFDEWEGWTSPEERWSNAKEYDVENLIIPIKADARSLPFAKGFFDAIICIDSYFYYGKDDGFLENILQFLRPGGKIGMVIPGYMKEPLDGVPDYISEFLGDELWTWETLEWWKSLWAKTGLVTIEVADTLQNGCAIWQRWDEVRDAVGKNDAPDEIKYFKMDKGEYIGFIRLVAEKNSLRRM